MTREHPTLNHWKLLAGLLLPMLPALVGCSNNPYPPGETAQSVIYSVSGDLKSLDPSVSYNTSESAVMDCTYPAFYKYHFLKQSPNYHLELALGAEEPKREPYPYTETEKGKTVQKQGEQWTFRIKKGMHFQPDPCFPGGIGREITADDILYSFRRMADPKVDCPILSYMQDKILGYDEFVAHSAKRADEEKDKDKHSIDITTPVAGLQRDPNDPYTFYIRLNQPYPQLRYLMAMHFTTPIPHEAVDHYKEGFSRHPVGCGAYMITEYREKQRITLEENPNRIEEFYPTEGDPGDKEAGYLEDAGKRLPLAKKVVFTYIKEGITSWNLFQQGYLDSAGVSQENYRQVLARPGELSEEMKRKGIEMQFSAEPHVSYFVFNMSDPLVGGYTPQKRKLRQALSTAIDSQAFIDLFNQGRGKAAQFLIPPGLFGYDPNYRNPYRQHDVAKAKQLLADAGYPGGKDPKTGRPLTIDYDVPDGDASQRQFIGLVSKQLADVGVVLHVQTWRDIVWEQRIQDGKFQFSNYGWVADYPDPENFVFLFYGPNKKVNYAQYDNPEYNKLFEQMRAMDDGPERQAVINKMRNLVVEDCPWVYLIHNEGMAIHYGWLHNTKPHGVAFDTLKYRRIDGPERARLQAAWNLPNYWPLLGIAIFVVLGTIPAVSTVRQRQNRSLRRKSEGEN